MFFWEQLDFFGVVTNFFQSFDLMIEFFCLLSVAIKTWQLIFLIVEVGLIKKICCSKKWLTFDLMYEIDTSKQMLM
jgi:hypothetical protein